MLDGLEYGSGRLEYREGLQFSETCSWDAMNESPAPKKRDRPSTQRRRPDEQQLGGERDASEQSWIAYPPRIFGDALAESNAVE